MLNAAGVPCGPIHRMDAVFSDPQVKHLQATSPVQHPTLGEQQVLSPAIRLSRTPAAVVSATPERGEHTPEVLSELGLSATEIAALRQQGVIL